ncbi:hypothetical protein M0804_004284 [Polistes exclamans]|nr:hypothetical protein M0804_004284 [Polistes exclamans]
MKLLRYVSLVSLLAISSFVTADEELYSDKYDYIDPMEIVKNDRLRDQYYNCFMNTGPCVTPDAIYFKDILPEALVTKCAKCTEKQIIILDKIINWFEENDKETWKSILSKAIDKYQNKKNRS